MNNTFGSLHPEYMEKEQLYTKLCDQITIQINELLLSNKLDLLFPIECRVKSWDSIAEKCLKSGNKLQCLSDISDIAGIRIILLYKRDLIKTCSIIESNFNILRKEDVLNRLGDNQFGYGSIHYELKLPKKWLETPTLRKLEDLTAEVQVRTASQHIWAASSHILQYKKEKDVPSQLQRTINRVAALLETVDLEFERVLSERDEYIEHITTNNDLNIETLINVMDELLPVENKGENESYDLILGELKQFGVEDIKQLREIIKKNLKDAIERDKELVRENIKAPESPKDKSRLLKGVFFLHTGLMRIIFLKQFGKKYDKYLKEASKQKYGK